MDQSNRLNHINITQNNLTVFKHSKFIYNYLNNSNINNLTRPEILSISLGGFLLFLVFISLIVFSIVKFTKTLVKNYKDRTSQKRSALNHKNNLIKENIIKNHDSYYRDMYNIQATKSNNFNNRKSRISYKQNSEKKSKSAFYQESFAQHFLFRSTSKLNLKNNKKGRISEHFTCYSKNNLKNQHLTSEYNHYYESFKHALNKKQNEKKQKNNKKKSFFNAKSSNNNSKNCHRIGFYGNKDGGIDDNVCLVLSPSLYTVVSPSIHLSPTSEEVQCSNDQCHKHNKNPYCQIGNLNVNKSLKATDDDLKKNYLEKIESNSEKFLYSNLPNKNLCAKINEKFNCRVENQYDYVIKKPACTEDVEQKPEINMMCDMRRYLLPAKDDSHTPTNIHYEKELKMNKQTDDDGNYKENKTPKNNEKNPEKSSQKEQNKFSQKQKAIMDFKKCRKSYDGEVGSNSAQTIITKEPKHRIVDGEKESAKNDIIYSDKDYNDKIYITDGDKITDKDEDSDGGKIRYYNSEVENIIKGGLKGFDGAGADENDVLMMTDEEKIDFSNIDITHSSTEFNSIYTYNGRNEEKNVIIKQYNELKNKAININSSQKKLLNFPKINFPSNQIESVNKCYSANSMNSPEKNNINNSSINSDYVIFDKDHHKSSKKPNEIILKPRLQTTQLHGKYHLFSPSQDPRQSWYLINTSSRQPLSSYLISPPNKLTTSISKLHKSSLQPISTSKFTMDSDKKTSQFYLDKPRQPIMGKTRLCDKKKETLNEILNYVLSNQIKKDEDSNNESKIKDINCYNKRALNNCKNFNKDIFRRNNAEQILEYNGSLTKRNNAYDVIYFENSDANSNKTTSIIKTPMKNTIENKKNFIIHKDCEKIAESCLNKPKSILKDSDHIYQRLNFVSKSPADKPTEHPSTLHLSLPVSSPVLTPPKSPVNNNDYYNDQNFPIMLNNSSSASLPSLLTPLSPPPDFASNPSKALKPTTSTQSPSTPPTPPTAYISKSQFHFKSSLLSSPIFSSSSFFRKCSTDLVRRRFYRPLRDNNQNKKNNKNNNNKNNKNDNINFISSSENFGNNNSKTFSSQNNNFNNTILNFIANSKNYSLYNKRYNENNNKDNRNSSNNVEPNDNNNNNINWDNNYNNMINKTEKKCNNNNMNNNQNNEIINKNFNFKNKKNNFKELISSKQKAHNTNDEAYTQKHDKIEGTNENFDSLISEAVDKKFKYKTEGIFCDNKDYQNDYFYRSDDRLRYSCCDSTG